MAFLRTGERLGCLQPHPRVRGQGNGQEGRQGTWGREGRAWCEPWSLEETTENVFKGVPSSQG